jgi:CheY-like chemotaxis protein
MTLKLFVADDSVTIQKIVGLAFSSEDAVIQSVSSGDSALDEVRAFKPDIVLADVFMPGCNGYEVCARIKEDPELRNIPVILLVGTFEPFDEAEAARVKCDGYLTKPFDTSELIQTVYRLINKKDVSAPATEETAELMNIQAGAAPAGARKLASNNSWTSFLGSERVLDLFDTGILAAVQKRIGGRVQPIPACPAESQAPQREIGISDAMIDDIVSKVVRRMSTDVVREVAWEVVPELSEVIIRRTLEERNKHD